MERQTRQTRDGHLGRNPVFPGSAIVVIVATDNFQTFSDTYHELDLNGEA